MRELSLANLPRAIHLACEVKQLEFIEAEFDGPLYYEHTPDLMVALSTPLAILMYLDARRPYPKLLPTEPLALGQCLSTVERVLSGLDGNERKAIDQHLRRHRFILGDLFSAADLFVRTTDAGPAAYQDRVDEMVELLKTEKDDNDI